MSYIECGNSTITIGDNVSVAHGVTIIATSHSYEDKNTPIKYQPILKAPIVIKDDVWIGAKATLLHGVHVGKHSVIGANAVVTKNIPYGSISAGIPAKVIKQIID